MKKAPEVIQELFLRYCIYVNLCVLYEMAREILLLR